MSKQKSKFIKKVYPVVESIAGSLGIEKDKMRRSLIEKNNLEVKKNKYNLKPEEILILLPHCLQLMDCDTRVTNDINNCKRCGRCPIMNFLEIIEKFKVNVFIATGGTLARKAIKDLKPKAIIAVACERDLSSGIVDIGSLPVIGVLNDRPKGPCIDTLVDIDKIEQAIKFFLGEE